MFKMIFWTLNIQKVFQLSAQLENTFLQCSICKSIAIASVTVNFYKSFFFFFFFFPYTSLNISDSQTNGKRSFIDVGVIFRVS